MSKKVLILLAHQNMEKSVANKALIKGVKDMPGVTIINLYEEKSHPFDNDKFKELLTGNDAVIFQFPFYWASAPAILKKWTDEVFTGFAKKDFIAGKPLMVVTTTGSEYDAYRTGGRNMFTIDELIRPYQMIANHSGMKWVSPVVVYGLNDLESPDTISRIKKGVEEYKNRISTI